MASVVQNVGGSKKTTTTPTTNSNVLKTSANNASNYGNLAKNGVSAIGKAAAAAASIKGKAADTISQQNAEKAQTNWANNMKAKYYGASNTSSANDNTGNYTSSTDWANQMKAKYYGATNGNKVDYSNVSDNDDDTPTYYNNGDSNGSSVDTSSYYDDLMSAFMEMNSANREAALEAILQNLDAVKGTYKQQIQDVNDEYDKLVNENEVKKDRARRVIRENQANRGQLDSGMGRQEMLDMNIGYDNITTNLKAAREKAVNEIYNLITQAEAEANTNKANVNNSYQNALLEWKLANQ